MKSRKTGSIVAVLVAVIGAAVLVSSRSAAVEAVYPVERAAQVFRSQVWSRVVGVFRGSAAAAENLRLRRENDALKVLRGTVERLEAENARLRRVLQYSLRKQETWIPAGPSFTAFASAETLSSQSLQPAPQIKGISMASYIV